MQEITESSPQRFREAPWLEDSGSLMMKHRRGWLLGAPTWVDLDESIAMPLILAVGGGKGGVGKSLLSANLGAQLSMSGLRCLLIDMDLGSANLHTYFGYSRPHLTLTEFLNDESLTFLDLVIKCPIPGLGLIAGGRSDERTLRQKLGPAFFKRFWHEIQQSRQKYGFDVVLIDLGAGTHGLTLELFSLAHLGIITVLPEPTSIENAYVFLKAYLWRLIDNVGARMGKPEQAQVIQETLSHLVADRLDSGYLAGLRSQYGKFPEFIQKLGEVVLSRRTGILVNQVRTEEDRKIGASMDGICRRFFGLQSGNLGYLNYDDAAWKSLRNQRLLLLDFPHSLIVQRIKLAVQSLLTLCR